MNVPLKFGCQTYTWEMLGSAWTGGPGDLVAAIAYGGYTGIEITDTMIGPLSDHPREFARRLDDAGLTLVSFAFGSDGGFTERKQISADLEAARRWIDFAANFPGALVSAGSATVMSRGVRDEKFAVAAQIYNRAHDIGRAAGVTVAIYPSSHHNTLLFSRADYDRSSPYWTRRWDGSPTPVTSCEAGSRSMRRWQRITIASATFISRTSTVRAAGRCLVRVVATSPL